MMTSGKFKEDTKTEKYTRYRREQQSGEAGADASMQGFAVDAPRGGGKRWISPQFNSNDPMPKQFELSNLVPSAAEHKVKS